mmetsp:Transcript_41658/g.50513  ORF Transcript_41658/g.50513 Transcript_41658/m.50513 type:complete len:450 (-) Transcript_41658:883-2232(-)|eukprot:CAMPEP_0197864586 /NCGR_PEP_ID=MMETSP1438-20131217/42922_1 /TAXON_ID=1461541 /ORGANISM="Pterosperma sp., Strain CCMP1384" /LENGTH=449 /DNA_ID=CAMNT_0043482879 /DNA_START=212 /DNA_END=1561 /DNA_ORIENTATION=-
MRPDKLARLAYYVLCTLLLALTASLLLSEPRVEELLRGWEVLDPGCDPNPDKTSCANDCFGQGECVKGVCRCDAGRTGVDCSYEFCPNDCNHQGVCNKGVCLCEAQFGGPDCSVDRLEVLGNSLLENLNFDISFQNSCEFLTKSDLAKYGGDKTLYWSDITGQMETYSIPEEMSEVLPDECPGYHFKTCAVVGNSGTTLFETFGAEIDKHEMVYRFNQAPTDGFEEYIGNRTMFESLNAKFAHQLMKGEPGWRWRDPLAVYVLFEPLKLQEAYVTIRQKYPAVDVVLFSPEFFVQAHNIYDRLQENLEKHEFGCFTGEKPMSGFYGVLYALSACDKVDLYGFDPWTDLMARSRTKRYRYHYFDDEEPRHGAHSFDATFYMYRLMSMSPKANIEVHAVNVPRVEEGDDRYHNKTLGSEGAGEIEEPRRISHKFKKGKAAPVQVPPVFDTR